MAVASCHEAGPWPSATTTEVSREPIDRTDEGRIPGQHIFLQMCLVKERAVGDDRSGNGNEDAATNVANEVDDSGDLVARLFRKPDIRRVGEGDKAEGNWDHLKNS
jgi:hypothetical protein